MRVIQTTVYKFNELADSAKEKAREWARGNIELAWSDESLDSIRAFCAEFGIKLTNWNIGPFAPIDYSTDQDKSNFRGRKLREFKRDNTPTGYCLDCALWQTFYDEFKRTGNARDAFDHAIYTGFKAWRDDMESQYEDDYIDDFLTANEYEFTENGAIH